MRTMDGVFLLLHEASRLFPGEVLSKRLEHSDRRVIHDGAQTLADHFDARLADELRRSLALVESARSMLRRDPTELRDEIVLIKQFQRGVLIWTLGVDLSLSIAERASGLIEDAIPRSDLAADVIEFIGAGARMAGFGSACLVGLEVVDERLSARFLELLERTSFISFVLRATAEIRRVFGPDARFGIAEFFYPDDPGAWELHLVIDAPVKAQLADAALDRLCEEWWDEAVAELGVDFFPVLATLPHE